MKINDWKMIGIWLMWLNFTDNMEMEGAIDILGGNMYQALLILFFNQLKQTLLDY